MPSVSKKDRMDGRRSSQDCLNCCFFGYKNHLKPTCYGWIRYFFWCPFSGCPSGQAHGMLGQMTRGKPSQIWSSEWQLMMINGQFGWLNHVQPPRSSKFAEILFFRALWFGSRFSGQFLNVFDSTGDAGSTARIARAKFVAIQQQNRTIIHQWWKVHPCSMEMALFVSNNGSCLVGEWLRSQQTNYVSNCSVFDS